MRADHAAVLVDWSDVVVILGPRHSGKTTTAAERLRALLRHAPDADVLIASCGPPGMYAKEQLPRDEQKRVTLAHTRTSLMGQHYDIVWFEEIEDLPLRFVEQVLARQRRSTDTPIIVTAGFGRDGLCLNVALILRRFPGAQLYGFEPIERQT